MTTFSFASRVNRKPAIRYFEGAGWCLSVNPASGEWHICDSWSDAVRRLDRYLGT